MINILRKIRQEFLHGKKFSKYLLYAIGEIVLVVFGILIALQINSWNEYSKNRKLEKEYYAQFKLELEENIRNANDQIQYSSYQISNSKIVEHVLETNNIYEDSLELYLAIENLGRTYPAQYINNIWTELLSNGKTSIIRNSEFRQKLVFLNSEMLQLTSIQNEFSQNNIEYGRLIGSIFSIRITKELNSKMHPIRLIDSTQILDLPSQKLIIDKLKAIKGLSGYIAEIYQNKIVNKDLFERHKNLMLELIEICESEIQK